MLPLRPIQGGCLCTSQDPGRFRSPRTTEADSTVPLTSAFPAWLLPHLSALPWGTRLGHTSLAAHTGFLTLSWPQFSSVTQSCPTLRDSMNRSTPGLPVHHQLQLPESTQTHVHRVGDAIQPSHILSSPSPPAPNPSQHQGLFQWINSSHAVAKVLEFQLQHQSFQWTPRTDLL